MEDGEVPNTLISGKYRLTRLLGRGGMGSVWEGQHTSLGTRVAVKFIDSEFANSPEAQSRFQNEARAAAALHSKYIVEVYDHGMTEDGRPFIVMEFLQGEPLSRRIERLGHLPPREAARFLWQVGRGLNKAHAGGIVHRDLKPENVFLVWDEEDGEDVAKVVDFGIAKFTGGMSDGPSSATRTGAVLGTPHYMSPEQARGLRTVDFRSDIWAMGVIAFRCIVGSLPFDGEAFGDLVFKLCTAPVPVPSTLATVPPGFDAWIGRTLAREPQARFSSALAAAEALAAICGFPLRTGDPTGEIAAARASLIEASAAAGAARAASLNTPADSTSDLGTAAPLTQTSPPAALPRRGGLVAGLLIGFTALAVGIGFGMRALKATSAADAAVPASAVPVQVASASPTPSAPIVVPAVSAATLVPAPLNSSPLRPSTSVSASVTTAARPVTPQAHRPVVTNPPRITPNPPANPPQPKPQIDVGF